MTALIAAVFVASLLGSLHCAGMCGAFVAFAVGAGERKKGGELRLHLAYNGGRLITYTLLGVVAGGLGQMVDLGGKMLGLQRVAAVSAGVLMVAFGVLTVLRLRGVELRALGVPKALRRLTVLGHRLAGGLAPTPRALSIGLLTTLLPCGWLYAFAVTAAGTASPFWGGLTMMVFWAGTLPVLVSFGAGIKRLSGPLAARLPMITAVAVVLVGLMTIVNRVRMPVLHPQAAVRAVQTAGPATTVGESAGFEVVTPSCCAPEPEAPKSAETFEVIDSEDLPCCHGE